MQLLALALLSAVLLAACGEDPTGSSTHAGPSPLAVVFTTDFPDVYGTIHVEIEGATEITLDETSSFSCEEPALLFDGDEIAFTALSEMNFFWSGTHSRKEKQACLEISLDAGTLNTGLVYFTRYDSTGRCLPASVSIRIEGRSEGLTGTISRSGKLIETEPPFTSGAEERRIFQAARDGKALAFGGGPQSFAFYEFEIQDPCGTATDGGYFFGEDGISGHGYEVSY